MPYTPMGQLSGDATLSEMRDYIIRLERKLDFLQQNLDTQNIFEVGGWRATQNQLASKDGDVGMSTADTGGDDVRIWAGGTDPETAPSQIRKSGKGKFTGVTIESNAGFPKILMDPDGRLFAAYTAADTYVGITPDFLGNGPALISVRNGLAEGATYSSSGQYHLVAIGDLKIESGFDIEFIPGGATGVKYPSWSQIYSISEGKSLKTELNAKATAGNSTSSVGSHNHGIPDGTVLVTSTGTVTWSSSGGHSHTQS